ncbi:PucR family transcriptional regulator [Vagococcus intermedius]|uniref:Helix-turn-helix domain-containing protein n=1 Tax=Vagococcus intermedius TaxID=2991418 RepID=A0AAF0CTW2_9ENTE|nr:helix-turn-helix domain-containing protein [Vagococcus intermedius]WEG72873.1 helix-turn-helix domain-containing protein [Vagococcus intermedius]WEG74960.1 helix-turn-helix domain-containing protein [Vagococcus intermedius]
MIEIDIAQLEEIYNFAIPQKKPMKNNYFLDIPLKDTWLCLPKERLTQTEIALLSSLFLEKQETMIDQHRHPWYQFLVNNQPIKKVTGKYRLLHFSMINNEKMTAKLEWLKAFTNMFDNPIDSFYITDTYGVLIEKKGKNNFSSEQLEGILLTLETDFNCKVSLYLGNFYPYSEKFPQLFSEERTISCQKETQISANQVTVFSQVALHYLTKDSIPDSSIMTYFQAHLLIDPTMKKIIKTLWLHQGNISSTSKELYMHRNTLQYRLEKFKDNTGLSLKNMDDLALSYLITLTQ